SLDVALHRKEHSVASRDFSPSEALDELVSVKGENVSVWENSTFLESASPDGGNVRPVRVAHSSKTLRSVQNTTRDPAAICTTKCRQAKQLKRGSKAAGGRGGEMWVQREKSFEK
ncbi:11135_t:CDS:2, partial [Acaulospora colombiana]